MNNLNRVLKLTSPCPSCERWREDKDECSTYCQSRINYLHRAFGEPWINCAVLFSKHQDDLSLITPGRHLDFSGPGPKAREFSCSICGATVLTSHNSQRTCGQGDCPKAYERLMDAARHDRNREHNNKVERERRRRKRLIGSI